VIYFNLLSILSFLSGRKCPFSFNVSGFDCSVRSTNREV
jgi:hypothetical protein